MKYIFIFFTIIFFIFLSCKNTNAVNNSSLASLDSRFYFNPNNAYNYIKKQTDFGPRIYGSEAHKKARDFFKEEIKSMGYEVFSNNFEAPYIKGRRGENIYAFLKKENDERENNEEYIIVASHYDSRSVAEKDSKIENRNKPIDGANDGASGAGILLELMRALKNEKLPYSVCFILFDLEDDGNLFYSGGNSLIETDWIQGSIAFVNEIILKDKTLSKEKIKFGILLDMVGGKNAQFKYESFAYAYYPNIYEKIWQFAKDLGYRNYFIKEHYGTITDDHTPFLIERIPFIDIIDMGYKYHHTLEDTIDKIDIKTIEAVGNTVEYVLKNADKIF